MRCSTERVGERNASSYPLSSWTVGLAVKARCARAKKETGNYPVPDEGHAISAKRLSRKQRKDGNLTKDEFDRINRKADKVLKSKD
jgi:hypothetical protein